MKILVKRLHPDAKLPSYAHPGDAGMDLFAVERTVVKAGERTAVKTGVSMEIPDGYVGLIWDKSGVAVKGGMKALGGVIDSGYRGEILVGIGNIGSTDYVFEAGHKVAQMLIQKIERPEIELADSLSDTSRGHGAFGSTGK